MNFALNVRIIIIRICSFYINDILKQMIVICHNLLIANCYLHILRQENIGFKNVSGLLVELY